VLVFTLDNVLNTAEKFFNDYPEGVSNPDFKAVDMQKAMSTRFRTSVAFTGLGYAAEGTGNSPALGSEDALRSLVTQDFVLTNVSLSEAEAATVSRYHHQF
jgi:hypothetical protein